MFMSVFYSFFFSPFPPYILYTGGRNQFELTQPKGVLCAPQRNKLEEAHTFLVSFYFSPPTSFSHMLV